MDVAINGEAVYFLWLSFSGRYKCRFPESHHILETRVPSKSSRTTLKVWWRFKKAKECTTFSRWRYIVWLCMFIRYMYFDPCIFSMVLSAFCTRGRRYFYPLWYTNLYGPKVSFLSLCLIPTFSHNMDIKIFWNGEAVNIIPAVWLDYPQCNTAGNRCSQMMALIAEIADVKAVRFHNSNYVSDLLFLR